MDKNFWINRWKANDVNGFHGPDANPFLAKYFSRLQLPKESRIFLPLCGKSLGIAWLLTHGYRVAGAELSELAITQLFSELKVTPEITKLCNLKRYSAPQVDIFVGDFFDLSASLLGKVDAVYDRAALVALPPQMRGTYTAHLKEIAGGVPQLVISYEYDQKLMDGPPFSVPNKEVEGHYKEHYQMTLLESVAVPGGLKGKCAATENVWHLK